MKVAKIRQGEKREGRQQIIADFRRHEHDSGSPDVQIALLTDRITYLTEHLKANKKDFHSRHGLLKMVAQRNRHLEYLRRTEFERYKTLIGKLGLRK